MHNLNQLNFVKLVHTDQATGITAIRTRFGTEARCMSGHTQRQICFIQNFVADQVGDRHFGCRDQRIAAGFRFFFQWFGMEQVTGKFR